MELLHQAQKPTELVVAVIYGGVLNCEKANARRLYEKVYCGRGDMENRIKESQADLFADRTSTAILRANQLRLWFASFAYVLPGPCAASASSARSSPRPIAQPSDSSCSRSARSCESPSAASSSPWPHPSPTTPIPDRPRPARSGGALTNQTDAQSKDRKSEAAEAARPQFSSKRHSASRARARAIAWSPRGKNKPSQVAV